MLFLNVINALKPTSWIILDKSNNKPVCELYEQALVTRINKAKCHAVPVLDYFAIVLPRLLNNKETN